jgi:hypothetical protein
MTSFRRQISTVVELYFFPIMVGLFAGLASAAIFNRFLTLFFYSVFIGAFISGMTTLFTILLQKRVKKVTWRSTEKIINVALLTLVSSLATFSMLATIPLNVDRSFTVWMLNQIDLEPELNTHLKVENKAEMFFQAESGEIARRINEQVFLENLKYERGVLILTPRGKLQVKFHRLISEIFGLSEKYTSND